MKIFFLFFAFFSVMALTGCAKKVPYDYTAFRESRPASILVLPAQNETTDINAAHSFVSMVTQPLAESGYYVFPVAVVEETFKQNGLTNATDIRSVSAAKLHSIFNADAALYIDVTRYGTKYVLVDSVTIVTATAKLVDLRSGKQIWSGIASASDNENNNTNSGLGILVAAVVKQISNKVTDKAHTIAGVAGKRLLTANPNGGILAGPRATAVKP